MPTGADTRNPRGLMRAARESRKQMAAVDAQVDGFLAELAQTAALAEAFDDAVMREDEKAVVKLLKKGGIKGEITIEKIDADRSVRYTVCVLRDFICVSGTIDW